MSNPPALQRSRPHDAAPCYVERARVRRPRRRALQQRRRQQDGVPDLPGRLVQRPDDHRHRRRGPDADQDRRALLRRDRPGSRSGSDYAEPRRRPRADLPGLRRPVACTASPPPTARTSARRCSRPSCAPRRATRRSLRDAPEDLPDRQLPRALRQRDRHPGDDVRRRPDVAPRLGSPIWGSNAVSGHDSWYSSDPARPRATSPLDAHRRRSACPPGNRAYLWFQQWRVLDVRRARRATTVAPSRSTTPPTPAGPVDAVGVSRGSTGRSTPCRQPQRRSRRPSAATASGGSPAGSTCPRSPARPCARSSRCVPTWSSATSGWWLDDISIYTCDGGDDRDRRHHPHAHAHAHRQPSSTPGARLRPPSRPCTAVEGRGGLGRPSCPGSSRPPTRRSVIGYQVSIRAT